ncbi:MAG: pilus assembly protein PilM [Minisyncoccia bacterium]
MVGFLNAPKRKRSFFDFFPTPRFLELSKVGVAFSDQNIHLVEFKKSHRAGDLSIDHYNAVALLTGVILGGYIYEQEALVKALRDLKSKHSFDYVRATLPEEKAYLFTTEVDKEPFDSLRDRVAFIIEENVPVSLAESVFDFEIIGNIKDKEQIRVAVSVLPLKAVETYIHVFEAAGITPVSFDVESQALARAIVPNGDERTQLIVNLEENKTGLYVVEDEIVQFSSTPAFGAVKDENGYRDLLALKSEMRKVFAFWNTKLGIDGAPGKKIEKILIAGRGAKDDNFVSALMEDMDIEYEVANVWVNAFSLFGDLPDISFEESLAYGVSVGVALPEKEPRYV